MTHERRKHSRFAIAADVDMSSGDNFYSARTRDISVGGLFIETPASLPIGATVAVRLKLEDENFAMNAEVAWHLVGDDGEVVGLGVSFVDIPVETRDRIEGFMLKRAPLPFEMDVESVPPKGPPPLPKP